MSSFVNRRFRIGPENRPRRSRPTHRPAAKCGPMATVMPRLWRQLPPIARPSDGLAAACRGPQASPTIARPNRILYLNRLAVKTHAAGGRHRHRLGIGIPLDPGPPDIGAANGKSRPLAGPALPLSQRGAGRSPPAAWIRYARSGSGSPRRSPGCRVSRWCPPRSPRCRRSAGWHRY